MDPAGRGHLFRYESFATDAERGLLTCRYWLDGREFAERFTLPPGPRWHTAEARAAARLVFLLAGVSYYKTAAPPVIDLGGTALTETELAFLREFYLQGLGEFAYRNALDLSDLRIEAVLAPAGQAPISTSRGRALVPFGGGIDSIVVVERIRRLADAALFVVNRPSDRFEAIEAPAAVTGLPIVRAEREIDPQLLRSAELGFLNGHVPVTGILSALAVLAAVLTERDAVVMSNEWSASVPTLEYHGQPVNHQYSKSASFEAALRQVLAAIPARMPEYFSWLRDRTELWVGQEFGALAEYHGSFRSCNKAFYSDPGRQARPLVRAVRQVLLHRPDPGAVPARRGAAADLQDHRRAAGGSPAGREVPGSARRGGQALRVRGRGHRVPGRGPAGRPPGRPGQPAGGRLLQDLAAEVAGWPDAPTDADAAAMLRPVGESFVPVGYR